MEPFIAIKAVLAAGLVILGVMSITKSLRTMISGKHDIRNDDAVSKQIMSEDTRYWIGRYYGPFNGLIAGLLLMGLAYIAYFSNGQEFL